MDDREYCAKTFDRSFKLYYLKHGEQVAKKMVKNACNFVKNLNDLKTRYLGHLKEQLEEVDH